VKKLPSYAKNNRVYFRFERWFMNIVATVLLSVMLTLASCRGDGIPPNFGDSENVRSENVKVAQTVVNRISDDNAITLYSRLLPPLRYNKRLDDALELDNLKATDLLVYRKQTIKPENIADIQDGLSKYPNLVASFVAANETAKNLEDQYDVYDPTKPLSGPRPADEFYLKAKSRYPNAKAAVSFSNIGIDSEDKTALLYVEYYSPDRGLLKFYLVLELERYAPIKDRFVISFINSVKVLPVR
jgi:hypothetical protein